MLATRPLTATRFSSAARPGCWTRRSLRLLPGTLALCAAVAICLLTPNARVFANEADSTPSSPKVPTAKKSRKKEVQEKAQNATPAPFNRSATSPAKATDSGAQAGAGSKREEKVEKAPLASLPPPDTATPPPRLPEASREKMRACAIEWSKLKLEARDPMPLWRDFGAQCLKR